MSVSKIPVALIQILDSRGQVTNFEIEYSKTYTGDDPDIARNFKPSRDREEVSAEQFAALSSVSENVSARTVQELNTLNAKLQEDIKAANLTKQSTETTMLQEIGRLETALATAAAENESLRNKLSSIARLANSP